MELLATITISMLFLYVSVLTKFVSPVDLVLLPWIIWIGKKLIETIKMCKQQILNIEETYNNRLKVIRSESYQ